MAGQTGTMELTPLQLSLVLASLTTISLLVVGLPLAFFVSRSQSRWRGVVDALVTLPLVIPPTVLGFYLLMALGPRSPIGAAIESIGGFRLVFSFPGLWLGAMILNLPFAVRPFAASIGAVDQRLMEAAYTLGDSPFKAFFRVILPLSWPGIVGGCVLVFVHTLGEFGVALMIGGAIPGRTQTLSIDLYNKVQAMDYTGAHGVALALVGTSFVGLCAVYLNRPRGARPLH